MFADASDFRRLGRAFERLPKEIRIKAMARTMSRLEGKAKTRVVRESAKHSSAPQKAIKPNIRARTRGEYTSIRLKTRWLSWHYLGAKPRAKGVYLRRRGRVRDAFFATMKSGHRNAFVRTGLESPKIVGLYGPNPAHAIKGNDDHYADILLDIAESDGADRLIHEIGFLLRKI